MSSGKASSPQISPVMHGVAEYIARALKKPLPKPVLEKTKHHVLDTIAAMVSGSRLLPGRKAISYVKTRGGTPEACVVASRIVTSAENAALANGMLAHADETDDSHSPTGQHPGCGIVAGTLAMAERERANGAAFLRAVALGYDLSARLIRALQSHDFRDVGHSTNTFGPMLGAAGAAGALAGLGYDQVRYLVSYATQQMSGMRCWHRDTEHIEKAFDFGGMPARAGVAAATMVAHGFTGVDDVFAGARNFFVAYDESARIGKPPEPKLLLVGLGSTYEIMDTTIKRWSVGHPVQAPLDALAVLIETHSFTADEIEHVTVRIASLSAHIVDNNEMPDVCLQYLCAVMLLDSTVTFEASHSRARMKERRVQALRRRIEIIGDDTMTQLYKERALRQSIVEVKLKDGRKLTHHAKAVSGTPENPMTRAQVGEKAVHLMAPTLGKKRAQALCDAIWDLEQVSDMRKLRPLLRA